MRVAQRKGQLATEDILVGCDAGFLNGVKIKGAHTAIKTGMLAAESVYEALANDEVYSELTSFEEAVKKSWVHDELYRARNFGPSLHHLGTFFGAALKRIAGFYATAHGHFHVHVRINTAGHHQQSRYVMHCSIGHIQSTANGLDPATLQQEVSNIIIDCRYDSATCDQHFFHAGSPWQIGFPICRCYMPE